MGKVKGLLGGGIGNEDAAKVSNIVVLLGVGHAVNVVEVGDAVEGMSGAVLADVLRRPKSTPTARKPAIGPSS